MKVYLAGPIQNVSDDGRTWREYVTDTYDQFEWLNPQPLEEELPPSEIVAHDRQMIDDSDALLLKYQKVASYGTPREHEYAVSKGKPVFAFTGESEPSVWVRDDVEVLAGTVDGAVAALTQHFSV